ncbi:MAG TPA: RidA family protein [Lysobacter sp.]
MRRAIHPVDSTYALAHEVSQPGRLLFVSGQVPEADDGSVPAGFAAQCRLAFANVEAQLKAADMTFDHLAKLTVFLSDRKYRDEARRVRHEMLGHLKVPPALTVVITGIYDEAWLLEIEAIAIA